MKLIILSIIFVLCDALNLRHTSSLSENFNDANFNQIDKEINYLKSILDYENIYNYNDKIIFKCFYPNQIYDNNIKIINLKNCNKTNEGQHSIYYKDFKLLDIDVYHNIIKFIKDNNLDIRGINYENNENNNNRNIIAQLPCYKIIDSEEEPVKEQEIVRYNENYDEYTIKENILNIIIQNKILYNKYIDIKNKYGDKKDIQKTILKKLKEFYKNL